MTVEADGKMGKDLLREDKVEDGSVTKVDATSGRWFKFTLLRRKSTLEMAQRTLSQERRFLEYLDLCKLVST